MVDTKDVTLWRINYSLSMALAIIITTWCNHYANDCDNMTAYKWDLLTLPLIYTSAFVVCLYYLVKDEVAHHIIVGLIFIPSIVLLESLTLVLLDRQVVKALDVIVIVDTR